MVRSSSLSVSFTWRKYSATLVSGWLSSTEERMNMTNCATVIFISPAAVSRAAVKTISKKRIYYFYCLSGSVTRI